MRWLKTLIHNDAGQDMVEYGLLSALISIIAIVTLKSIGPIIASFYNLKYTISRAG